MIVIIDEEREDSTPIGVTGYETDHVPAVGDVLATDAGLFVVTSRRWRVIGRRCPSVTLRVRRP